MLCVVKMFSSSPGLYPLEVSSSHTLLCLLCGQPQMSPDSPPLVGNCWLQEEETGSWKSVRWATRQKNLRSRIPEVTQLPGQFLWGFPKHELRLPVHTTDPDRRSSTQHCNFIWGNDLAFVSFPSFSLHFGLPICQW